MQTGDKVKVKNLTSFKQTEGSAELLSEVFYVHDIVDSMIYLEDYNEVVLDDVFTEEELLII